MTDTLSKVAPGYYNANQIRAVADDSFSEEFNAIPEADQVPWDTQGDDKTTFCEQTLFLGYLKVDEVLYKVNACMLRSTGEIHFYHQGMRLTRSDNARVQFGLPWAYLRRRGDRPQLEDLQVLCQHYFVAAGFARGVAVDKEGRWFRLLKRACKDVGVGMGMLVKPGRRAVQEVEEDDDEVVASNHEGSDADDEDTVVGEDAEVEVEELDVYMTSRILQRLLGFARGRNAHWGKRVEEELKVAWPGMKSYWR